MEEWFYCLFAQDSEYCKYSLCIMLSVCTVQKCFSLRATGEFCMHTVPNSAHSP